MYRSLRCRVLIPGFLFALLLAAPEVRGQISPKPGVEFPAGFWEAVRASGGLQYGDPGWVRRMARRKGLVLEAAAKNGAAPRIQDRFKVPVLLGSFADVAGKTSVAAYHEHLFGFNPTGNLTQFYDEVSYGQFELTGSTHGWYTAPNPRSYYLGSNSGFGSSGPNSGGGFVRTIVELSDPEVDYGQFDNDGPDGIPNSGDDDGVADGVIVVAAGAGPDWGGTGIWPHVTRLGGNAYTTNDASANGGTILVNTYAVCPELSGSSDEGTQLRTLGVFAHEFGHILGLPDLYDRTDGDEGPDYDDSEGIGNWGLMAGGSWLGTSGDTPNHMSAWSKLQMGWITPKVVTASTDGVQLRSLAEHGDALLVWIDAQQGSRYFLVENRQRTGFDRALPGDGLLIYHIDENRQYGKTLWSSGGMNDDETHKLMDVEEADGLADLDNARNRGDVGDPFPGSSGNRAFTDASTPDARDYDGTATGIQITGIGDSGPVMTADVRIERPLGYRLAYDENGIGSETLGYGSGTWAGVRFTAPVSGTLTSVDIGFPWPGNSYEVVVFGSFDGTTSGEPLLRVPGYTAEAGWHTVSLPAETPITVEAGEDFFIGVDLKGQSASYDGDGVASGRSYLSGDGVSWFNFTEASGYPYDVNVRARIGPGAPTGAVAPVAVFSAAAEPGDPHAFSFDASASSDADGDALWFDWSFGDGETGAGERVSHRYAAPGTYTVTLTVSDPGGLTGQATQQVRVASKTSGQLHTVSSIPAGSEFYVPRYDYVMPVDSGFVFGTNYTGDRQLAAALELPAGEAAGEVRQVRIWWGYRADGLTDEAYTLHLYGGDAFSGPQGDPLYSETLRLADVQADADFGTAPVPTTYELARPVSVGSSFFVAVDFGTEYQDDPTQWGLAGLATSENVFDVVDATWAHWNETWYNPSTDWWSDEHGFHLWMEASVATASAVATEQEEVPAAYRLAPNYPNPFNPATAIGFDLPEAARVRLAVFDVLGREVALLVDEQRPAGRHAVRFEAGHLPSGVYLYRLEAGSYRETRRLVLQK